VSFGLCATFVWCGLWPPGWPAAGLVEIRVRSSSPRVCAALCPVNVGIVFLGCLLISVVIYLLRCGDWLVL
jgi:hypothetical protein